MYDMSDREMDQYFLNIYDEGLYEAVKETTLNEVNRNHYPLLNQVYLALEQEMYAIAIPSLMLIIEGEISELSSDKSLVGNTLVKSWKIESTKTDTVKKDEFLKARILAFTKFVSKNLFIYKDFQDERRPFINRNWVAHGRDDSSLWTKTDAYKLINFLETVVEIKLNMEWDQI